MLSGGDGIGTSLVSGILVVSGLLFCLAGVLILLFLNVLAGMVLLVVGLADLASSVVISRSSGVQD